MSSWLTLHILVTTLLTCGAQQYYVTPTPPPNPNCPTNTTCETLTYYARNTSVLINGRENVSLLFMNGYHVSQTIFEIANVDCFTIAGLDSNINVVSTTIGLTRILISNGTIFTLKNIAISDTLLNVSNFQSINNHKVLCDKSILSQRATKVDHVSLTNSRLDHCQWLLFWGYNDAVGLHDPVQTAAIGISTETNSAPTIELSETEVSNESLTLLAVARSGTISVRLNIDFCSFMNTNGLLVASHTVGELLSESNLSIKMKRVFMTDDSLGTVVYANQTHNVYVDISECHFIALANDSRTIEITANGTTTINATVEDNDFIGGLGVTVYATSTTKLTLTVSRCNFTQANLDSIRFDSNQSTANILIEECRFIEGLNVDSALLFRDRVILARVDTPHSTNIVLRNSLILNNHFLSGILVILGPIHMTINSCIIKNNSGLISGGLLAIYANVTLMGDTIFDNNTGSTGGAIYLYESSLVFTEDLHLVFTNNKAELTGGAIFITEINSPTFGNEIVSAASQPNPKCFYQLATYVTGNSTSKLSVTFINNTAATAGDNIYGASLKDECTVTPDKLTQSYEVQDTLFDFQQPSKSSVSSSPRRVCVCESGEPKCTDMDYIFIKKFLTPGENVFIDVKLVGHDFGATAGSIFATELRTVTEAETNTLLGDGEEIKYLDSKSSCTRLDYSVSAEGDGTTPFILTSSNLNADTIVRTLNLHFTQEIVNKSIQEFNKFGVIDTILLYVPIFITIDLLPCPMGLEIDNTTGVCGCKRQLVNDGIATRCIVEEGRTLFTRNEFLRSWIRIHNDSKHGLIFEYTRSCLYANCNSKAIEIDPRYPDTQCALNHSGVLCGGCSEGLSLTLGSSRCIKCPDSSHIALILAFLALGALLVLFIWILDLTITRGTINGLLFYVNVISINSDIFFLENTGLSDTLNNCLKAAKLFIDWCNLDFGIESCFIYRMNAQTKIWLQFLFPLYVWSLAGLIIVACKYSTKLTRIFGSHSVSVLITLFLIAYMKLVRVIIVAFAFADIVNFNGEVVHKVWLVDGNVNYNAPSHIILCVFSGVLAVLLFSVTIWLILIKITLRFPKHHKIDPILDSFIGRLKKDHGYWIGLSLLTRVALSFVTILAFRDTVLRVLIVVVFILALIVSHVYKRVYLSLLEAAFLLNLLAVSVIFVGQNSNETLAISISTSVLISALMFLGICIYHGITTVKRVRPKVVKFLKKQREKKQKIKEAEDSQEVPKTPTSTEVNLDYDITMSTDMNVSSQNPKPRMAADYSNYREELLDSTAL